MKKAAEIHPSYEEEVAGDMLLALPIPSKIDQLMTRNTGHGAIFYSWFVEPI